MSLLFKNATLVTAEKSFNSDVLIEQGLIVKIASHISAHADQEIDCTGKYILPGMIDTHVHFRDPGLTHKADAHTESIAALSGGVTTICDMPNTKPPTITYLDLKEKQNLYAEKCFCNYGIYIGAARNNLEELKKADEDETIPGIKIFMAESTGEMTLDQEAYLKPIFQNTNKLIATHAEDEARRLDRLAKFQQGELPENKELEAHDPYQHAVIRDNLMTTLGTQKAVDLALQYQHRLHILHVSAQEELAHIVKGQAAGLVSAETAPHYLFFTREDIKKSGTYRIMNPCLKGQEDQDALWKALRSGIITQVSTDHAPHLPEEKSKPYGQAPAGVPGIEFVLPLLLNSVQDGRLTLKQVVALTSANPARNYGIKKRGFLEEGYFADLAIIDPKQKIIISNDMVRSKCGWTPYVGFNLEGGLVEKTIVNGNLIFDRGEIVNQEKGKSIEVTK